MNFTIGSYSFAESLLCQMAKFCGLTICQKNVKAATTNFVGRRRRSNFKLYFPITSFE